MQCCLWYTSCTQIGYVINPAVVSLVSLAVVHVHEQCLVCGLHAHTCAVCPSCNHMTFEWGSSNCYTQPPLSRYRATVVKSMFIVLLVALISCVHSLQVTRSMSYMHWVVIARRV